MSSVNYENQLLDAIETIANNAVVKAGYDRTIKGIVEECLDAAAGKYSIKYQDTIFEAYSNNIEVSYSKGALVQILIPGNDMGQNKTIIGAVDKTQVEYVTVLEGDTQYENVGSNVLAPDRMYGLCSYKKEDIKVLYDRDAEINLIHLDETTFANNIENAEVIIAGAEFRTELNEEQKAKGNFGIAFELDFKDNISGATITRKYVVDVNKMTGNPYSQMQSTRQFGIFGINKDNYDSVKRIYIFSNSFPVEDEEITRNDIYVGAMELTCADKLTEDELKNYSLTLSTEKNYFDASSAEDDVISINSVFRIKGRIAGSDTLVAYYWFKENAEIVAGTAKYNAVGGEGWECINQYNLIDSQAETREWLSGKDILNIKKKDVSTGTTNYKCAVVYNDTVISKSIKLYNYDALYDIDIISDEGNIFYYDNGTPSLTLLVNGEEESREDFVYKWATVDENGMYNYLEETTEYNTEYEDAAAGYKQLQAEISAGTAMPAASQQKLDEYLTIMRKYDTIQRVKENKISKIQMREVLGKITYKCSVWYKTSEGQVYIGTSSIDLENKLLTEGEYHLEIIDGTQTYNYNYLGTSPASEALTDPIVIKPLTFNIYDNNGKELGGNILENCEIEWTIPTVDNTMLIPLDNPNKLQFNYTIADIYDNSKTDNTIKLQVRYKDLVLNAETNLTFTKEGNPGINGTEMVCKIVPNTTEELTTYPMVVNGMLNYTPAAENRWFKLQLWKNGKIIFEGTDTGNSSENLPVNLEWSVLRNIYNTDNNDVSSVSINGSSFTYNGYNENSANIIRCKVIYDNTYYYETLPLITSEVNSGYSVTLEPSTGFQFVEYTSAGKEPKYDNTNPFTLKVTKEINGFIEDITNSNNGDYHITYSWMKRGRTFTNAWIDSNNLTILSDLAGNVKNYKPSDTYTGECVNNAVEAKLQIGSTTIGKIHIPIHFYLNKNGISSLNDWDGNKISINNNNGSILAPQVGAGKKENGTFTGVLMGSVKETGTSQPEEGLFGYYRGERTIFLDAKTGRTTLGKSGLGQIIIDPTTTKGYIYSGAYALGSSGMMIDLTSPEIRWGNGNFAVNSNGYLTAKGGGNIAGWKITDDRLYSDTTEANGRITIQSNANGQRGSIYSHDHNTLGSTGTGFYLAYDGLSIGSAFKVENNGKLSASNVAITGGSLTIGSAFSVDSSGKLSASGVNISGNITASTGKIADYTISGAMLVGNNVGLSGTSGQGWAFWAGSNDPGSASFRVGHDGQVHCTNLNATGGSIAGKLVTSGINASNISSGTLNIVNGSHYLKMGFGTKHPEVSGLNMTGGGGLALHGNGIGECGSIQMAGEAVGPTTTFYLQAAQGVSSYNYHIMRFKCGILVAHENK